MRLQGIRQKKIVLQGHAISRVHVNFKRVLFTLDIYCKRSSTYKLGVL